MENAQLGGSVVSPAKGIPVTADSLQNNTERLEGIAHRLRSLLDRLQGPRPTEAPAAGTKDPVPSGQLIRLQVIQERQAGWLAGIEQDLTEIEGII